MTQEIAARVDAGLGTFKQKLVDLVRIPSVSSSAFDQSALDRSAEWIATELSGLGFATEIIKLETSTGYVGRPAILAERAPAAGKLTVLLYAHHDVQPPGESAGWDQEDPFTCVERDGRLYGRGAADDKAGVMAHIAAISCADPGVGIRIFIEGEEEIGSPSFTEFLETYRDRLEADAIVVADSNNWKVGTPSLTTSLRGVASLDVELSVLDHAVHSGMWGGVVLDAVTLTARLIATLHDESGDVAVAGLDGSDHTQVDYPEADLRADAGILGGVELAGTGSLSSRLWTKPAINVIGMDVTPTAVASNTLIPRTKTTLSVRVAPSQDPLGAAEAVKAHLEANVPFGAHITVTINEAGPGFEAPQEGTIRDTMLDALQEAFGTEPVDIGVGGSIPFISDLSKVFPDAEILVTGIEDPDTRAHSENESLHLGDWRNAIVAEAILLSKLGR